MKNLLNKSVLTAGMFLCIGCLWLWIRLESSLARAPELANVCRNNLRAIAAAKETWASKHQPKSGAPISKNDLAAELSDQRMWHCPLGGNYHIGNFGESPTCSLGSTVTPSHCLP